MNDNDNDGGNDVDDNLLMTNMNMVNMKTAMMTKIMDGAVFVPASQNLLILW